MKLIYSAILIITLMIGVSASYLDSGTKIICQNVTYTLINRINLTGISVFSSTSNYINLDGKYIFNFTSNASDNDIDLITLSQNEYVFNVTCSGCVYNITIENIYLPSVRVTRDGVVIPNWTLSGDVLTIHGWSNSENQYEVEIFTLHKLQLTDLAFDTDGRLDIEYTGTGINVSVDGISYVPLDGTSPDTFVIPASKMKEEMTIYYQIPAGQNVSRSNITYQQGSASNYRGVYEDVSSWLTILPIILVVLGAGILILGTGVISGEQVDLESAIISVGVVTIGMVVIFLILQRMDTVVLGGYGALKEAMVSNNTILYG